MAGPWLALDRCVSPRVGAPAPEGPTPTGDSASLPRRALRGMRCVTATRGAACSPGSVRAAPCSGLQASVGRGRGGGQARSQTCISSVFKFRICQPGREEAVLVGPSWPWSEPRDKSPQQPRPAHSDRSLCGGRGQSSEPSPEGDAQWPCFLICPRRGQANCRCSVPVGQGRNLIRQAPRAGC